jgi:hypothetical protein
MAKRLTVLLGALAAGAGALFFFGKKANAEPAQSGIPEGWNPPSGAVFEVMPATNATRLALNSWTWRDQGALGKTILVANKANAKTDWVAFFAPDANPSQVAILTRGTTPNSGLIAQAGAAGLLD